MEICKPGSDLIRLAFVSKCYVPWWQKVTGERLQVRDDGSWTAMEMRKRKGLNLTHKTKNYQVLVINSSSKR